jgi:hypothetical protein
MVMREEFPVRRARKPGEGELAGRGGADSFRSSERDDAG